MNKKIVFVCNHLYGGGAERVLTLLANYFDFEKYKVSIIVYDGKKSYPLNIGIKVIEIGDSNSLLRQAILTRKKIKKINPDIVISFEYFVNLCTIIACLGINTRIIVSERNDPSIVGAGRIKGRLRNFLYRFCDKLVCQTQDAMNYFPQYIRKKTCIILNPIKNDLPKIWNGERTKEIVAFCRLNKQKNLPLLIDAFKEFEESHKEYYLSIFGDGEELDNLKKYIREKNCFKIVKIYHGRNDIHNRVLNAAMFISSSDYEGLSNSMLEAMAIGLPTICTDCPCGGARMVIKNGENGLLVPVGNKDELVYAMKKIADNLELSQKLSQNASKLKLELSIERIATKWKMLF